MFKYLAFTILISTICVTALAKSSGSLEDISDDDIVGVVGGESANVDQAPWQALLVLKNKYIQYEICQAVIISKKAVLTAAQCCAGNYDIELEPEELRIRYGGLNRTQLTHETNITHVIIQPEYNSKLMENDICVLILKDEIKDEANVKVIEIADTEPSNGTLAEFTSWGVTDRQSSATPQQLEHAQLTILDFDDCATKWSNAGITVTDAMLCTISTNSGTCRNDQGGPLVVDKKLVGLNSFENVDCPQNNTEYPDVFSNVVIHKKWILEQISKYTKIIRN